jgi:hypothetical protein
MIFSADAGMNIRQAKNLEVIVTAIKSGALKQTPRSFNK